MACHVVMGAVLMLMSKTLFFCVTMSVKYSCNTYCVSKNVFNVLWYVSMDICYVVMSFVEDTMYI
jgi:hypothetical protein